MLVDERFAQTLLLLINVFFRQIPIKRTVRTFGSWISSPSELYKIDVEGEERKPKFHLRQRPLFLVKCH